MSSCSELGGGKEKKLSEGHRGRWDKCCMLIFIVATMALRHCQLCLSLSGPWVSHMAQAAMSVLGPQQGPVRAGLQLPTALPCLMGPAQPGLAAGPPLGLALASLLPQGGAQSLGLRLLWCPQLFWSWWGSGMGTGWQTLLWWTLWGVPAAPTHLR